MGSTRAGWAVYIGANGKAAVDLYCFARLSRVISEHPTKPEADAALVLYRSRAATEAKADEGQRELGL